MIPSLQKMATYHDYILSQSFPTGNKFVYYDERDAAFVDLMLKLRVGAAPSPDLDVSVRGFLGVGLDDKTFRWERQADVALGSKPKSDAMDAIAKSGEVGYVIEHRVTVNLLTKFQSTGLFFDSINVHPNVVIANRRMGVYTKEDEPEHRPKLLGKEELRIVFLHLKSSATVYVKKFFVTIQFDNGFPSNLQEVVVRLFDPFGIIAIRKSKILFDFSGGVTLLPHALYVFTDILMNGDHRRQVVLPESKGFVNEFYVRRFRFKYNVDTHEELFIKGYEMNSSLDVKFVVGLLSLLNRELSEKGAKIASDYERNAVTSSVVTKRQTGKTKVRLKPLDKAEPLVFRHFKYSQRCQHRRQPRVWKSNQDFYRAFTRSLKQDVTYQNVKGGDDEDDERSRDNAYIKEFLKRQKSKGTFYQNLDNYMLYFPKADALAMYPDGVQTRLYTCIPDAVDKLVIPRLVETEDLPPVPCCFQMGAAQVSSVASHLLGADKQVTEYRVGKLNFYQNVVFDDSIKRYGLGSFMSAMNTIAEAKRHIVKGKLAKKPSDGQLQQDLKDTYLSLDRFLKGTTAKAAVGNKKVPNYFTEDGKVVIRDPNDPNLYVKDAQKGTTHLYDMENNVLSLERWQAMRQKYKGTLDTFDIAFDWFGDSLGIWSTLLKLNICTFDRRVLWYATVAEYTGGNGGTEFPTLPYNNSVYLYKSPLGKYEALKRTQVVFAGGKSDEFTRYIRFQQKFIHGQCKFVR